MPFRNTPKELKADNTTPYDLSRLREYSVMMQPDYEELFTAPHDSRAVNRKYYAGAGCRVIQNIPRNTFSEREKLFDGRDEAAQELAQRLKKIKRTAKFKIKPPLWGDIDKHGFSRKSDASIDNKAIEYRDIEGDNLPYSRIIDPIRTTLVCETAEDIQRLSEFFRPCAMGGILRFFNAFSQPYMENDLRRIQVNPRMSNGVAAEVAIIQAASVPFYDKSLKEYAKQRAANQGMARASANKRTAPQTHRAAGKISQRAQRNRIDQNTAAAALEPVAILQARREFLCVSGIPVVLNHDNWEGTTFALVANPTSGYWETDQRFLDLVRGADDVDQTTPYDLELRARALTNNADVREALTRG